MNCEIITIGSEILLGDIVNTHSKFLSQHLNDLGFDVLWHTSVGDNKNRLKMAVELAINRSDLIILTGGLGPTQDDITKEIVAETLNEELIENATLKEIIQFKFKNSDNKIIENNLKQAKIFKDAVVFENKNGIAPGLVIEKNNKIIVLLPGPPNELQPMFKNCVMPYLKKFSSYVILSKNVHLYGIAESQVDCKISNLLKQSNPSVGIYAKKNEVRLRITCKQKTEKECLGKINDVLKQIQEKFKPYIYGVDVKNLETALVQNLINCGKTLAIAESCTGGLVAAKIVSVLNASKCLKFGAVCYTNEIKNKILNVNKNDLEQFGAVSPTVARQMADNVRLISNSDIGVSTTGLASPVKLNNLEQPAGLVFFGISTKKNSSVVKINFQDKFKLSREEIINLAADYAMNLVLKSILNLDGCEQ